MIPDTHSTEDSEFLSLDGTERYLIPLEGWRQAQQPPANGIEILPPVVEQSAVK